MSFFDHPLFKQFQELNLSSDDYAICGSGPMWVRGIRDSHDLDVVARGSAWETAKLLGRLEWMEDGVQRVSLAEGGVEIFNGWGFGRWSADELIDTADLIEGIRFINLQIVLEYKRQLAREKDLADIKLIEHWLKRQGK